MNPAIKSGFHNSRHRILGQALEPYSAGHAFALDGGEWPGLGTIAGLLGFLRVCSRPIGKHGVPKGFPDLKPGALDVLRCAWLLWPRNLAATQAACRRYLEDYGTAPAVSWPSGGNVKTEEFTGCTILAAVVAGVRSGLTYDDAWSMPLGALRTWTAHFDATDVNPHKPRPRIENPEEDAVAMEEHRRLNPHLLRTA